MKILTILGSPKKNGKTASVLELFEKKMEEKGNDVKRINIVDYNINGCKGCMACVQRTNEMGCIQNDDVPIIFKDFIDSDVLVYASPLYGWDVTSQMKALLDRHFSLVKGYKTPEYFSFLEDKLFFSLTTCIGEEAGNTDLVLKFYRRFSDMLNCPNLKQYIVPLSFNPDFFERAEVVAQRMADDVV